MIQQKQNILCVLYDDPTTGFPPEYARNNIPELTHYPDGQTLPTVEEINFTPGHLLGCVSGGFKAIEFNPVIAFLGNRECSSWKDLVFLIVDC